MWIENDSLHHYFLVVLVNFPSCFINSPINIHMHSQSFRRRSSFCPVLCIFQGQEWCSAPASADVGEESVLYGVELRAIWGIMHHYDVFPNPLGEFHEVLFDNPMRAGVGSSAVTEDGDGVCIGILLVQVPLPYKLEVVTCKLGRVMVLSEDEISFVFLCVVYTIWYELSIREGGKVVVEGFRSPLTDDLPTSLEVAYEFFLLGVYAENGDAIFFALPSRSCNLLELLVTAFDLLQWQILLEGAPSVAKLIKNLLDDVACCIDAAVMQYGQKFCDAYRLPPCRVILRESRSVGLYHGDYLFLHAWMLFELPLTATTSSSNVFIIRCIVGRQLVPSLIHGRFAYAKELAYQSNPMVAMLKGECGKVDSALVFIERLHIFDGCFHELIWGIFWYHLKCLNYPSKVLKIPQISHI